MQPERKGREAKYASVIISELSAIVSVFLMADDATIIEAIVPKESHLRKRVI
jgi:hypothetical protein